MTREHLARCKTRAEIEPMMKCALSVSSERSTGTFKLFEHMRRMMIKARIPCPHDIAEDEEMMLQLYVS